MTLDTHVGELILIMDGQINAATAATGYGLECHVYDPDGTYLAYLEGARNRAYLAELLGPGSGSFVINANDTKATTTNIAPENLVEVRWNGTTIGWWVIQRKSRRIVIGSPDQEEIEVSGQGLIGLFKKVILYPHCWPAINDPDSLSQQLIAAPNAGMAFFGMLNGSVDLPFVLTFDHTQDTDGAAWTDDVYLEFRAGQTMWDVIDALHGRGYHIMAAASSTRKINAYATTGTDVSDKVVFRQGLNIITATLDETTEDHATVVLGEGQDVYVQTTDFDWTTRRRGAFLPARNAINETQLAAANTDFLDRHSLPITILDLTVRQMTNYAYGVDYQLGDTIHVGIGTTVDADYVVYAVHLQETDNNPHDVRASLVVNEVPTMYQQKVMAAINAGTGMGASAGWRLISQDTRANRSLVTCDWYISGAITTGDGKGQIYEVRTRSRIVDCVLTAGTAPGSTATFDIEYSVDEMTTWSSLFSTRPTIPGSSKKSVSGAFEATVLYPNTYLRFCVDATGSAAAQNVGARLRMRES